MIKRFWFASADAGDAPWRLALDAPGDSAPLRVTESTALPDLEPDPPWTRIGTAWFGDVRHLERFDGCVDSDGVVSLVAEEVVVRGADWLDRRWPDGRPRLKHLALARRHPRLTPAEFSERWRSHAGHLGSTPIPEAARGRAYVQNHPLLRQGAGRPYDAVTEVWFDDLADLRSRIAWMRDALATAPPDDLFGDRLLLAVREDVLLPR